MNKKTTKIMATALAATMGAGMATQLVQAAEMTPVQAVEAMEKNPTAANIDKAYALVQAMEAGKEKDELNARIVKVAGPMHEAAHKAVEAAEASKDLKDVAAARKLVVGLPNIFQQDKWTWSASLDTLTMVPEMKVHDTLDAINKGGEVKQATINELRPMIDGLGLQGEDNEGLNKHVLDYSANLDTIQFAYIDSVKEMVKAATSQEELDAAKAKYDDLMTMTNEELKAGVKADLGALIEAKETLMKEVVVESVSAIDNTTFEISVVLNKEVNEDLLKGSKLTLTKGETSLEASFVKVDEKNAVYVVDNKGALQPGNGSADGTYVVTATALTVSEGTVTTYSEVLTGNMIKGFVYNNKSTAEPVVGATVEVNGRTVKTDAYGFYSIPSNSGIRTVTVTAPGYFKGENNEVKVSRNYSTAENFVLDIFDQGELYVHGIAMDDKTSQPINSAVVDLYELNGEKWIKVGTATTGADGKYNFANKDVTGNINGIAANKFTKNELEIEKAYKVVINKELSSTNLNNVYHEKSVEFALSESQKETNMKNVAVTPVKEVNKATFQVDWTRDAEAALTAPDKASFTVDIVDVTGKTKLVSGIALTDLAVTDGKLTEAYDFVSNGNFGSGVKPTLPTGTYFLIVNDGVNAISVIPMSVTEGNDVATELTTIKVAKSGTISSTISNVKYAEALANQTDGSKLKSVTNAAGAVGSDEVGVSYTLTQKVAGVDVIIGNVSAQSFVYTATPTSMATTSTIDKLIEGVEYTVTPVQSLIRGTASKVVAGGAVSSTTASYSSAADIEKVTLSNDSNLNGKDLTVNNVKLVDKNGNVIAETGAFKIAGYATGNGITIPHDAFDGVAPGEYKVVIDIAGFKPVDGKIEKVIDFQKATLTVDKAFEAIEKTSIKGYIRFADSNENVADGDTNADASVIIYNANGKIVAANDFGTAADQATYSIEDGVNGTLEAGTYTMVVRGEGFETLTKQIKISENEENIIDVQVVKGGTAKAKLAVRDNNNAPLSGVILLHDKYYVANTSATVDEDAVYTFDGEYELAGTGTVEWSSQEELSVGEYSLVATGNNIVTYSDVITIANVGDTYYGSITVSNRVQGKVVPLTVKFAGDATSRDFAIVRDSKGNIVTVGREAAGNSDAITVEVGANDTYTVEVYSNGKFVGKSDVTVQDFAKQVTVGLDEAKRD